MKKKLLLMLIIAFTSTMVVNAQTPVFQESFEGAFPPTGWTLINAGTGNNWTQNTTAAYAYHGTKSMLYGYSTPSAANAWAITPAVALNTNTATISFYVSVRSGSYPENLKFTVGNAATVAAQTNTLLDSAGLTNTGFRKWTTQYTPSSAGNFFFGFNCYSIADQWNLYVDSITITQVVPACSGAPNGGTSSATTTYICGSGTSILSVANATQSAGISYQWQSSPASANTFTDVSTGTGATTTSYTTATLTANTDFRCKVTCANGGAIAYSTITTVTIASIPANDDFCGAITLVKDAAALCSNTTCATSTGDPAFASSTPNNTVWYKYTPTTSGVVNIVMSRPSGVTSGLLYGWLGVYTATGTCPTLTFTEVTPGLSAYDLPNNPSVTLVTSSLTAGTTYYFMVDGVSGAFGAFCIQLVTPPIPPSCVTNVSPANAATNVAAPVANITWNTAVGATDYDVYFGTANPPVLLGTIIAPTVTVPISGLLYNTQYFWYVVPKNLGGSATGCTSNITSFTTQAAPPAPVNDECSGAISLSPYNGTLNGTTASATASASIPTCTAAIGTPDDDVWYKITALQSGSATITVTAGAGFDPVLQAFSGTCAALTNISCANATLSGGVETLTLTLVGGTTYYLRVYGFGTVALVTYGSFTIAASGVALPVAISNFRGDKVGSINQLSWITSTEVNNAGFELQRSADGSNFSTLEFVKSLAVNGNSNATLNYQFADTKAFTTNAYYRLKQMDRDGKYSYSNIVLIKGGKATKLEITSVYPNPVSNTLNLIVVAPANDKVTIVVSDITGKILSQKLVQLATGDNNVPIDVSKLAVGTYMIKAICESGCDSGTKKFVKN